MTTAEEIIRPVTGESLSPTKEVKYKTLVFPIPDVPETSEFLQAAYLVGDVRKWWHYQLGTGVHAELEVVLTQGAEVSAQFFPMAYFRYDKKSEIGDKGSASYKSTKALVSKLGMDYDKIATAINENPDIKDVIQAFFTFGIPAESTDQLELRYLFRFFERVYTMGGISNSPGSFQNTFQSRLLSGSKPGLESYNRISLEIADKRFRMFLREPLKTAVFSSVLAETAQ